MRRALAGLAVALVVFGAGMLVYPLATDIYTNRAQGRLRREFATRLAQTPALAPAPAVSDGQGLALIKIPRLGVDSVVVEGTDPRALRNGPGHYAGSPQPCGRGNAAIAGHRTTYGQPFNGLDELVAGDRIVVVMPHQRCTYEVVTGPAGAATPRPGSASWVTSATDWSVVGALPGSLPGSLSGSLSGSFLTLTTCHPKTSAALRLIVRARLVSLS